MAILVYITYSYIFTAAVISFRNSKLCIHRVTMT